MCYSAQAAIAKISWIWFVNRRLEFLEALAGVVVMQISSTARFTGEDAELRSEETKNLSGQDVAHAGSCQFLSHPKNRVGLTAGNRKLSL